MEETSKSFDLIPWFRNNYLKVIITMLLIYLILAFIAPVLMATGNPLLAKAIYRGLSSLCHQFAHRSWFLFGEQAFYPLETRGNFLSVFDVFDVPPENPELSREIIGNVQTGYKVAVCQRDVALYGALLFFAIIFIASKKSIKQISPGLWVLFAVMPIGIDGLLQLASSYGLLPFMYESNPLLRSMTGALFGFFSGWILFPAIEKSLERERINNDPAS